MPETVVRNSGRTLNTAYKEKLIAKILLHYGGRLLMPSPLRAGGCGVPLSEISCRGTVLYPERED